MSAAARPSGGTPSPGGVLDEDLDDLRAVAGRRCLEVRALDSDVDGGVLLVASLRAADVGGAARRRDLGARRVQAACRRNDANGVFLKVHVADEGERRCIVARDLRDPALVGAGDGHGRNRRVERDRVADCGRFVADVVAHLDIDRLEAVAGGQRDGFCRGECLPRRFRLGLRRLRAPDLHLVARRCLVGDRDLSRDGRAGRVLCTVVQDQR